MYQIRLEQFEGPLDLLLQLIEKEELDIEKIFLAKLTDQFVEYLNQNKNIGMDELADFLVVAAKLLFIKSQILFPELSLEEEGISLETQLKIYKEYWEAAKEISRMIAQKHFVFFREKLPLERAFRPPPRLTAEKLKTVFCEVIRQIEPFVKIPKQLVIKKISLEERIKELRELILGKALVSFGALVKSKDKLEKIVHFLALLELIKQKIVNVEQSDLFGEITVKRI